MEDKQEAFAKEYVIDYNATQAAIRAGYSEKTAYSQGNRLLKKVEVQAMIKKLEAEASKRTQVSKDMVIRELARVAFVDARKLFDENGKPKDIRMLDDDTAAALASVDIYEEFDYNGDGKELTGYTKKYKWADKLRALEMLGKHLGMFTDKVHVEGSVDTGADKLANILAQLKEE
jgi:phage terminase small subunit